MVITKDDKNRLLVALETEQARIRRAANACRSDAMKEILVADLNAITALHGRVYNEVVK